MHIAHRLFLLSFQDLKQQIWKWCWFNKPRRKRGGGKANDRHEVRKGKEVGMKETNGSETSSRNKRKKGDKGQMVGMKQEEGVDRKEKKVTYVT
jgi:hypothetical protein